MSLIPLRKAAGGLLLVAAGASVALACCGAERAQEFLRYYGACAAVAALAGAALVAVGVPVVRALRAAPGARLAVVRAGWPACALHVGFACVLGGWLAGQFLSPAEGSLRLRAGQTGSVAGEWYLALDDFSIDRWPDTGTVRQYTSRGRVAPTPPARGAGTPVTIAVNRPLVRDGWWVYQNSYQEMTNPHTGRPLYFTILLCVKDVGLPWAAAGGALLILGAGGWLLAWWRRTRLKGEALARVPPLVRGLYFATFAGAVAMLVHRGLATGHAPMQNMYEFLMCAAAAIPVLTVLALRRPGGVSPARILLVDAALQALVLVPVAFFMDGRVKHLMPALQSPLFVPHVGSYVAGYIVLVRAAFGVGRRLVGTGFFLMSAGLVLGAVWGKICWGHWWQFDPKEMWSLATWCVYAAYFHARVPEGSRAERLYLGAGAVMIVLTLTWINLSRLFAGMHSYA